MEVCARALPSVTNHEEGPMDLHQPEPFYGPRHLATAKLLSEKEIEKVCRHLLNYQVAYRRVPENY